MVNIKLFLTQAAIVLWNRRTLLQLMLRSVIDGKGTTADSEMYSKRKSAPLCGQKGGGSE